MLQHTLVKAWELSISLGRDGQCRLSGREQISAMNVVDLQNDTGSLWLVVIQGSLTKGL